MSRKLHNPIAKKTCSSRHSTETNLWTSHNWNFDEYIFWKISKFRYQEFILFAPYYSHRNVNFNSSRFPSPVLPECCSIIVHTSSKCTRNRPCLNISEFTPKRNYKRKLQAIFSIINIQFKVEFNLLIKLSFNYAKQNPSCVFLLHFLTDKLCLLKELFAVASHGRDCMVHCMGRVGLSFSLLWLSMEV